VTQAPSGLAVTAQMDMSDVELDEEQHVQPSQPDAVDGEEVAATIPAACRRRNTRQVVAIRRGAGSSPWRRSVVRTAVAETQIRRRCSSPLMRW
jgi:hypothetical protein